MAVAVQSDLNDTDTLTFNLESARIQSWWDAIQSRNRYFFELVEMKLYYVENADLYLLILEMDDCIDDLDTMECPYTAHHLRDGLERAVTDLTLGLVQLGQNNIPKAQIYFNTAKSGYQQTLHSFFELLP